MPLGDSITRGTNDINYPNGDIPGGYRRNLGVLLSNGGFAYDFVGSKNDNAAAGMDPDHNGTNGIRTDQVLANLSTWMAVQPDTVLMMLGTNDILQGVPVATAASNLSSLINQITSGFPKRRLYVSTVLPISGKDWNGQTAAQLNANANSYNVQVRNLVQQYRNSGRNVTLVDMNATLVYTNSNPANNVFQPGDGVHPGQAGYNQMGGIWYNSITAGGSLLDPPSGIPTAPNSLTASAVSASQVNLTWNDAASNETGFKVYQQTGSQSAWVQIATLTANTTSLAVSGLATGSTNYYFAVSASNAAGESALSNTASVLASNRALNKPASSSSNYAAAYDADNANDGAQNNIWSSTNSDTSASWSVDLSSAYQIQEVQVVTRQDVDQSVTRRNFEIRGSNDPSFGTYSVLASQGSTPLAHASTLIAPVSNSTGFRYLRVAKTDGGYFTLAEVKVFGATATTPPAPYDSWASNYPAFQALPPADRLPSSDPNRDGISNLLAYGMGADPLANTAAALLPQATPAAGATPGMVFKYRRNKLATDLEQQVFVSSDLSHWTLQSQSAATVTPVVGNNNAELIAVTIPLAPGSNHVFARLNVIRNP